MLAAWENGEDKNLSEKFKLFCNKKRIGGNILQFYEAAIHSLKTFTEIRVEEPILMYLVIFIYMRGMCNFLRKC